MDNSRKIFRIENLSFLFFFLCALAARLLFFRQPAVFDYDQAVFALQAKHILEFKEFPIFPPFSHYGGTLASYAGALLFKIFGVSSPTWNAVAIIYSCTWIILVYTLAKKLLTTAGSLATFVFVCLPPWDILVFSLFPGLLAETLVCGTWFFLLLVKYHESTNFNRSLVAAIGFVAGFGLWLTPHMIPFILTALTIALLRPNRKKLLTGELPPFLLGFCAGYCPGIIYSLQHPGAQLYRFAGRILDLDRSILSSPDIHTVVLKKILWRISTIPQSLLQIPGMIISLFGFFPAGAFLGGIILAWKKRYFLADNGEKINAFGVFFILIAWFTIFYSVLVGNKAARYMVPLVIIAPFFIGLLGQAIRKKSKIVFGVFIGLIILSGIFSIGKGIAEKKTPAYPEFAGWLIQKGIRQAYADPWSAYCVQFESDEKVILSPTLTHPMFYERWPKQTELVSRAAETVFVVNEKSHPEIAGILEKNLLRLQISYHKESFRGFSVYTDLSRKIYPEELTGFGNPVTPDKRN